MPVLGHLLRLLIPEANYYYILPLLNFQVRQSAPLDSFHWLLPAYDNLQIPQTILRLLQLLGLQHIEVLLAGHFFGLGSFS